jgi:hypothetical protein
MSFFHRGKDHPSIITHVFPIVFLDLWLENVSCFAKKSQSEVSHWTLGGPAAGSFAGGINLERTHFFKNMEVEERRLPLGAVSEQNCLMNTCSLRGMEDLVHQGN